jgi:hypothetical protein
MLKKSLLIFALAGLSIASAKTYSITLLSPTTVGTKQLRPGDYKLTLDGSKATFTNTYDRKSFQTDVKVEHASRKFSQTAVDTTNSGGSDHLQAIELQGTTTKLDFN